MRADAAMLATLLPCCSHYHVPAEAQCYSCCVYYSTSPSNQVPCTRAGIMYDRTSTAKRAPCSVQCTRAGMADLRGLNASTRATMAYSVLCRTEGRPAPHNSYNFISASEQPVSKKKTPPGDCMERCTWEPKMPNDRKCGLDGRDFVSQKWHTGKTAWALPIAQRPPTTRGVKARANAHGHGYI